MKCYNIARLNRVFRSRVKEVCQVYTLQQAVSKWGYQKEQLLERLEKTISRYYFSEFGVLADVLLTFDDVSKKGLYILVKQCGESEIKMLLPVKYFNT